jgi:photosystem II stability/assembly factor-like uncharacterized protein
MDNIVYSILKKSISFILNRRVNGDMPRYTIHFQTLISISLCGLFFSATSCKSKSNDNVKTALLVAVSTLSTKSSTSKTTTATTSQVPCPIDIQGTKKGEPGNIQDNVFQSLAIDPTNENIIWAGTETSGVFKTTDGGTTWTRLRNGLGCDVSKVSYPQIYDVVVDKNNTNNVYMATVSAPGPVSDLKSAHAGFYKSTDAGITWKQSVTGFSSTYLNRIYMDPNNSSILYSAVGGALQDGVQGQTTNPFYEGSLLKSTDSGATWTALTLSDAAKKNAFLSIFIPADNSNKILLSGFLHDSGNGASALGLIVSLDGGATWTSKNPTNSGAGAIKYFDVFKTNSNIIYASDDTLKKVFKSIDGGANWTVTNLASIDALKVHPTDSSIVITANFTKLSRSTDSGLTSVTVADTDPTGSVTGVKPQFLDVEFSNSNPTIVYAIAKGYTVWKSTNSGASFTQIVDFHSLIWP